MSRSNAGDQYVSRYGGWRAVFGCSYEALALFRVALGLVLLVELVLRFRFLHAFYTDEGTLPLHLLLPETDDLYRLICVHCGSGSLLFQQVLLGIQVLLAASFTIGYKTRLAAIASFFLYLSLTLRNTWLNFILDRYFHYLLFYSMFLPLDRVWSIQPNKTQPDKQHIFLSLATLALKMQVTWIYIDAGSGKYMDPLNGWTYGANPLPALDTYARHTLAARYLYALLTPQGLRLLTPTVVYVELLAAPLALLGSYFGNVTLVYTAVTLICSLHIGIACTLRNTVLLSLVACCAWCTFLPLFTTTATATATATTCTAKTDKNHPQPSKDVTAARTTRRSIYALVFNFVSWTCICSFISGSIWFETIVSEQCDSKSNSHIWSTLLHNRWNVFVGAEEYVTWEIAPGLLENGSVVDVWGRTDQVDWNMPGTGAPCTSTARPGRWRSFPYLAELEGESGDALWSYLCKEWDAEQQQQGRKLVKFNFFMLQADVLPNMGFSATRKRLIQSYECSSSSNSNNSMEEDEDDITQVHIEL